MSAWAISHCLGTPFHINKNKLYYINLKIIKIKKKVQIAGVWEQEENSGIRNQGQADNDSAVVFRDVCHHDIDNLFHV